MDVILKNVKEKHMKLIRALADQLELEIEKPDKPNEGTFIGQKHKPIEPGHETSPDLKMTMNDIDTLWE
jgi:hypothetical protein